MHTPRIELNRLDNIMVPVIVFHATLLNRSPEKPEAFDVLLVSAS